MFKSLERQFQRRAELLLMGRHLELARHCQFPLQMQLLDRSVIVQSAQDYALLMRRLHDGLTERGVQVLVAEVSAVELARGGSFRVWVSWEAMISATEEAPTSMAIYHGHLRESFFITDRIEYLSPDVSEIMAIAPRLAKSA